MRYLSYLLLIYLFIGCKHSDNRTNCHASYCLSYELKTPIKFANGEITTNNGINFSKNGKDLYVSKPKAKTFKNGKSFMGIVQYKYDEGRWSTPLNIDFMIDAYHPVLSTDNQKLFFNSRSHPDSINISVPHNIWCSEKTPKGWSKPRLLEQINSSSYDSYPSIASSNNLYFNSDRPGGKGGMDIYVSYYDNGVYQKPINIKEINSTHSENDLVIDPNERFIIFNRYIDSSNEIDLYISYKEGNVWKVPKRLDKINSPDDWELTPTLSPDGHYFFYELNGVIMQIDVTELH
ncbi:hypothetical protein [uncultured Psychroserpens sp.]|uniref:hypothetical protein n=1 Tax=uncultured Psychroserpens sp. TaxID=255436 RepID=UPI002611DC7B|nr:hypothetical protein [uncultured Psychroserpens sp.]